MMRKPLEKNGNLSIYLNKLLSEAIKLMHVIINFNLSILAVHIFILVQASINLEASLHGVLCLIIYRTTSSGEEKKQFLTYLPP